MNKRIVPLVFFIIGICALSGDAKMEDEPWDTVIGVKITAPAAKDMLVHVQKTVHTQVRSFPNCIDRSPEGGATIEFSQVHDASRTYPCDRILIITIQEVLEETRAHAILDNADSYLIKKKKKTYIVRGVLYDVHDRVVLITTSTRVKRNAIDHALIQALDLIRREYEKPKQVCVTTPPSHLPVPVIEIPQVLPPPPVVVEPIPPVPVPPPAPEPTTQAYLGLYVLGDVPVLRYRRYAQWGGGLGVIGALENPYFARHWISLSLSTAYMSPDKDDMRPYFLVPCDISGGYRFTYKNIEIVPYLGLSLLYHSIAGENFFDPGVSAMVRMAYPLWNQYSFFGSIGYTYFFEKKYNGSMVCVQIGIRKNFDIPHKNNH